MYFLGIDAGGSKTEAVIVDDSDNVLGGGRTAGANYHNSSLAEAVAEVHEAVRLALWEARITPGEISASVIGMASYDTPYDKALLTQAFQKDQLEYFGPNLTIVNDAVIGLYSGTTPPGICLVAGTGCNCYGVGSDGREAFAGGWSYLLGDEGGGYHLAVGIMRAVIKAFDGRGEKTILRDLLLARLNLTDEYALVDKMYNLKLTPTEISSIAAILADALRKKDTVARSIMLKQIEELVTSVSAVAKRVGLTTRQCKIVLIGSFFKTPFVVPELERKIRECLPEAKLVTPTSSPALGAVVLAREKMA